MFIRLKAAAKINLFLEINKKLQNDFHNITSIMQSVDLFDTLTLNLKEKENKNNNIEIKGNFGENIPTKKNTAFAAAELFFSSVKACGYNLEIEIEKNIPTMAGLAGGSTDAASVLLGLNKLFDNSFSASELQKIAKKIGADVPFCITGGTCLAKGIGDNLTPLSKIPNCYIALCKPNINILTKEAYQKYDSTKNKKTVPVNNLLHTIKNGDLKGISHNLYNRFEELCDNNDIKIIQKIKETFLKHGALGSLMTGSGSTVFGIFDDTTKANKLCQTLKKEYPKTYLCKPI